MTSDATKSDVNNMSYQDLLERSQALGLKACDYLTQSPDPFYAVHNSVTKLEAAGFVHLSKRTAFANDANAPKIVPGGKYYYTVNKTALVAFAVGPKYKKGNGFKIIGGSYYSTSVLIMLSAYLLKLAETECLTHALFLQLRPCLNFSDP
jgi:aspartyl aminopeptidase